MKRRGVRFCFVKQKRVYETRISDWSSDVCSSDLGATEELLRAFSVTFAGRVLTQYHELRGVQMKKGDKITSLLPAANYDPTVFDNPREINFKRPRKPMLAFAGGVHSCMGDRKSTRLNSSH